jgi:hypothetical protein
VVSWTAPDVTRIDEPFTGPERGILDGFLDWHRSTLLWKCAGLTGEQLAQASAPPSNLSLLGIVRHMADVERAWFRIRFHGEPLPRLYDYENAAFEHADPAGAEGDFAAFAEECDLARRAVARASLDQEFTRGGRTVSLRWVCTHMLEEYAPAHRRSNRLLIPGVRRPGCGTRLASGGRPRLNQWPAGTGMCHSRVAWRLTTPPCARTTSGASSGSG